MILLVGLLLVVALRWFPGFGFDGGFFRLFVLILFSFGLGLVGCLGSVVVLLRHGFWFGGVGWVLVGCYFKLIVLVLCASLFFGLIY